MSDRRKTFNMTFNKGIDKSSLPFEADPSRALEAVNYIYRDGKVQKRLGFNNLYNADGTSYASVDFATLFVYPVVKTNSKRFNGLWQFEAEDGQKHLIAHIGKLIYEVIVVDGEFTAQPIVAVSGLYDNVAYKCYEFEDYKSTAVIGNKMLYFFGGNKLMRLRFLPNGTVSFLPVEDNPDAYVPTTTISITYRNAKASGRANLDEVNLMTQWRKNKLLSGVGIDENAPDANSFQFVYQLDSPIVGRILGEVSNIRVKISRRK